MSIEISLERIATALENLVRVQTPAPADPTPAASATRKPRTPKPVGTVGTGATAAPMEASPAPAASSPAATESPTAAVPKAAASAPNAKPTLDDVRNALVQCQTRKNRDAALTVLKKYSASGTTGGLPEDKYATVISECNAA
jgi:hypothetical protein